MDGPYSRVIFINEFRGRQGPVACLVDDLALFLRRRQKAVELISCRGTYTPGGLRWRRIFNLLAMHLIVPARLLLLKLVTWISNDRPTIVVTTSPPLLHLSTALMCRVLRLRCLIWYLDAHPELEAKILAKRSQPLMAKLLRRLDSTLLGYARHIVTLDCGMQAFLARKTKQTTNIAVASPWTTYLEPALPLRLPKGKRRMRVIYAGNFGTAHSLEAFVGALDKLAPEQQQLFEVSFVGMAESSYKTLSAQFQRLSVTINFQGRFKNLEELVTFFRDFDFGLVCLDPSYCGLASPSKVLTYLSQGLPIIYCGPKQSLAGELVDKGWGIYANEASLLKLVQGDLSDIELRCGQTLPNPIAIAQSQIADLIADVTASKV